MENFIPTFKRHPVSKLHIASMLTDDEVIRGCIRGDRACQKALYDRYCGKMMVVCQRYSRSGLEAEDTLQEGFVKVFANIHKFRGDSKISTWMTRIMINTALNKQRQRLIMMPIVGYEDNVEQEEAVSLSDFHFSELLRVVQTLPDGCRVVFNLFAIEGYSHKEISEQLQISIGTSKSQYNRARSLLMARLASNEQTKSYGKANV
jgi:RNA polymerase sigma factor (sigma-70 family)